MPEEPRLHLVETHVSSEEYEERQSKRIADRGENLLKHATLIVTNAHLEQVRETKIPEILTAAAQVLSREFAFDPETDEWPLPAKLTVLKAAMENLATCSNGAQGWTGDARTAAKLPDHPEISHLLPDWY